MVCRKCSVSFWTPVLHSALAYNSGLLIVRRVLVTKGRDKKKQHDKTKAQRTLKEKRAQKRAKRQ